MHFKHLYVEFCWLQRFGWGDRLALGVPSRVGEGPDFEEAFGVVLETLSNSVPSLSLLLQQLLQQKRIALDSASTNPQFSADCPYQPSPAGVQIRGQAFVSPLTGSLLSFKYSAEAGATGLAHFVCKTRQLHEGLLGLFIRVKDGVLGFLISYYYWGLILGFIGVYYQGLLLGLGGWGLVQR